MYTTLEKRIEIMLQHSGNPNCAEYRNPRDAERTMEVARRTFRVGSAGSVASAVSSFNVSNILRAPFRTTGNNRGFPFQIDDTRKAQRS